MAREHNRICRDLSTAFPDLTDEQLYRFGRSYVTALISKITYDDFLPLLLGNDNNLVPYQGYDADVEPSITNVFSTSTIRLHASIPDAFLKMNNNGDILEAISVRDSVLNPSIISTGQDIGHLLKGQAHNVMKRMNLRMSN